MAGQIVAQQQLFPREAANSREEDFFELVSENEHVKPAAGRAGIYSAFRSTCTPAVIDVGPLINHVRREKLIGGRAAEHH
jgi:hypothetical protein